MNSIHVAKLSLLVVTAFSTSCSIMHSCPGDLCKEPSQEENFVPATMPGQGDRPEYPLWVTRGGGRPLLLLPALGGLDPCTLEYAVTMRKQGWKVYAAALWTDPQDRTRQGYGMCDVADSGSEIKASGRWTADSRDGAGPILQDVREMARWISRREGGQRVVVHGNCLTGIFPLALLSEPCVSTAVLCQPATPVMTKGQVIFSHQPKKNRVALGLSDEEVNRAFDALAADPSKKLLGFHYRDDPLGAFEKFEVIHERLVARGGNLAGRFQPFVLYPEGGEKEEWWNANSRTTTETRTIMGPHSTVTSAKDESDRQWFRDQLVLALR